MLKHMAVKGDRAWHVFNTRKNADSGPIATGFAAHSQAVDESDASYSFQSSKRKRRQARSNMLGYGYRNFVSDEDEVGPAPPNQKYVCSNPIIR